MLLDFSDRTRTGISKLISRCARRNINLITCNNNFTLTIVLPNRGQAKYQRLKNQSNQQDTQYNNDFSNLSSHFSFWYLLSVWRNICRQKLFNVEQCRQLFFSNSNQIWSIFLDTVWRKANFHFQRGREGESVICMNIFSWDHITFKKESWLRNLS